jgi:hypothetical protein
MEIFIVLGLATIVLGLLSFSWLLVSAVIQAFELRKLNKQYNKRYNTERN